MRSGNWNTRLEGLGFFLFFFCFNSASFQEQIRIWGLFVFTIGVLKDSLWNVLLFRKRKLRPKLVHPGWANGDSPICILLGRTLTLCVEEQVGVVLLTHVSGSWVGPELMKVFFFQGQTPASADLAILALMYSTWLTFSVRLPTLGLSCQVPSSLLPVLQAVQSCTQRVQLIFQCSYSCVGEISWIVSSLETTEARFQGSGCLLGSCHQSLALE